MELIKETTQFHIENKTAVAIGKFDGVHRGHRELLKEVQKAKKAGLKAAVFTFTPSPGTYFSGKTIQEITTKEEKRMLFQEIGIDYLVEYPFHIEAARMEPEQFVRDILVKRMSASLVVAGEDVSFGHKGRGNAELLKRLGAEEGFGTCIIPKICYENQVISSTYVREMIREGNMELVKELMGEPYFVEGIVETGKQLGRTMGMPTVNLLPHKEKLLPPNGVYFSTIEYGKNTYQGITNIGNKPTVGADNPVGVETYIYDFSEMIYGKQIKVNLLHFLRPERKFSGLEELKDAILNNIQQGREYFIETKRT